MHKTIPSHIFKEELSQQNTILVDVRTLEEQEKYGVISEKQLHIDVSKESAVEKSLNSIKPRYTLSIAGTESAAEKFLNIGKTYDL